MCRWNGFFPCGIHFSMHIIRVIFAMQNVLSCTTSCSDAPVVGFTISKVEWNRASDEKKVIASLGHQGQCVHAFRPTKFVRWQRNSGILMTYCVVRSIHSKDAKKQATERWLRAMCCYCRTARLVNCFNLKVKSIAPDSVVVCVRFYSIL